MSRSETDLDFCWEQVLKHDPWFRLHYLFTSQNQAKSILALHALFAMLEGTLDMSEEALSMSKLLWWRSELASENSRISAHPVVRTLRENSAVHLFSTEIVDPLIAQGLRRLQAEPVADMTELKNLCNSVGQARFSAELSLNSDEKTNQNYSGACAGTGLACLVEFVILSSQKSWWFIPMDLQARYQIDVQALQNHSPAAKQVFERIFDWGEAWFEEQIRELIQVAPNVVKRHLVAMTYAQKKRFENALQHCMESGPGEPGRWRLPDFFGVWSSTRRARY